MKNIYCIYGASGHSKVIIEILENSDKVIRHLYDDDIQKSTLLNYKVVNDEEIFKNEDFYWLIGIGDNKIRKKIAENHSLKYGYAFDKNASVSKRTEIAKGTVIMPGVNINSLVQIGMHCIINTNSSIDHDCQIDNFAHISPNATLCGGVIIGQGTHIGAGAVIIPGIKIGKWATIGAGTVIINDVADNATVVGNPGRIITIKQQNNEY